MQNKILFVTLLSRKSLKVKIMKLEKLTESQEKIMFKTRDEWINRFFETKEINKKEFEKGINWLYTDFLKKKKPKIIYCYSWLSALLTISILKNIYNKSSVGASVRDSVRASVGASVRASVGASVRGSVWDSVRGSVWDSVRDSVGDSVRDSVWDSVRASVGDSVRDSVRASVGASVWDSVKNEFSNYSHYLDSGSNFGWVSFYDYFEKIGVLKNCDFKKYKKLIKSGAFQVYEYENFVFAIQPPIKILRNENGQLNNISGKSFEWSDGYGFNYVNGFEISDELFSKLKNRELTLEQFFKQDNEEIKSAIIGFIQQQDGDEGVYRFFKDNLKEIDTYIDKKESKYLEGTTRGINVGVYTLFKGEINNIDIAYVRCYCPSTDRMFFLGVEPNNNNAKDSIASLYQVPGILKNNIVSISRQGEKFSTIFDEEITEKIKNNEIPKNELKNYVSISGEEYFRLITYEF